MGVKWLRTKTDISVQIRKYSAQQLDRRRIRPSVDIHRCEDLAQTAFARWHDVLATPPPPPTARGNCPASWAADYAQAVWHYVRVLGLAATAAGGADAKTHAEVAAELDGLEVCIGTVLKTLSTEFFKP